MPARRRQSSHRHGGEVALSTAPHSFARDPRSPTPDRNSSRLATAQGMPARRRQGSHRHDGEVALSLAPHSFAGGPRSATPARDSSRRQQSAYRHGAEAALSLAPLRLVRAQHNSTPARSSPPSAGRGTCRFADAGEHAATSTMLRGASLRTAPPVRIATRRLQEPQPHHSDADRASSSTKERASPRGRSGVEPRTAQHRPSTTRPEGMDVAARVSSASEGRTTQHDGTVAATRSFCPVGLRQRRPARRRRRTHRHVDEVDVPHPVRLRPNTTQPDATRVTSLSVGRGRRDAGEASTVAQARQRRASLSCGRLSSDRALRISTDRPSPPRVNTPSAGCSRRRIVADVVPIAASTKSCRTPLHATWTARCPTRRRSSLDPSTGSGTNRPFDGGLREEWSIIHHVHRRNWVNDDGIPFATLMN